jgi:hypothetical protein
MMRERERERERGKHKQEVREQKKTLKKIKQDQNEYICYTF